MVLLAWVVPIAIFFPTIMGWEAVSGQPIDRSGSTIGCNVAFANDRLFNFVLTVGYYWTTLVALIVLYVGIYRVALKLHRKSEEKQKRVTNTIFSMAGNNLSKFSVGLTEQATATATSTSAARAQDLRSVFTYTTTDVPEDSFTERSSSELPRLMSAATAAPSRADGLHLAVPSSNAEKSCSSTCTASESVELRPARSSPAAASAGYGVSAPASENSTAQHSALQHAATMRNAADDIRARRVRLVRHHSYNDTHTALEAIALSPPPVPPQVSLLMQLTRSPDSVPLIRYIDQSSPPSSRDSASGRATLAATTLADMQTQLSDADEGQMQQVAVIWQRRVSHSKPEHFAELSELSARAATGGEVEHRCSNGHDTISRTLSIHSPRYCRSKERLALTVDVYLVE